MGEKQNSCVMICAGEASGDLHGANLVKALKNKQPHCQFFGMGSECLKNEGVELLVDCKDIAVVGIFEVIKHWSKIKSALNTLKEAVKNNPPDLLILIDYVEFNLKLAAYAKSLGVKVLFYVSPQVWAWRSSRVPKIGKAIDMMAVLFPFETQIYEKHGVPVRYVGHPLAGEVHATQSKQEFCEQHSLDAHSPIIGLLPGSRRGEIQRILPILIKTAVHIQRRLPEVQFVLPLAPTLDEPLIQGVFSELEASDKDLDSNTLENVRAALCIAPGQMRNAVHASNAVLSASGTATLEVALLGVPMSIVYKVSGLSYAIFSRMIEIDHVGLPNIVAGKQVVPEFIQQDAQPEQIAQEVIKQLSDASYREGMIQDLQEVKAKLGEGGGSEKVAQLAYDMLLGDLS